MSYLRVRKERKYSLTSIDIRPFLESKKIEVGLIFLYNNQEAVRNITV